VTETGTPRYPDLLVFDLDPGPPATIVQCCEVALLVREALGSDGGLEAVPKTSGSKGLQLYVPLDGSSPWEDVHGYARALAQRLENDRADLVVWNMKKELRTGKVLVDWSQNNAAKTTVAVYSLRAREAPTVSTPVTWTKWKPAANPKTCGSPAAMSSPGWTSTATCSRAVSTATRNCHPPDLSAASRSHLLPCSDCWCIRAGSTSNRYNSQAGAPRLVAGWSRAGRARGVGPHHDGRAVRRRRPRRRLWR
jgi:hypothetical protein